MKKINSKVVGLIVAVAILLVGGATVFAAGVPNAWDSQKNLTSQGQEVTEEQAKQSAFTHAGVTQENVTACTVRLDVEDGVPVYEIDFWTADREYEYDVRRDNGEILKFSSELHNNGNSTSGTTETVSNNVSSSDSSTDSSAAITKEQAQTIALEHAGVQQADTQFLWVKADYDDGRAIYEVEFYANGTEYDYDIDRNTGTILSYDYDVEGFAPSSNTSAQGLISQEEASSIALAKVSGATTDNLRMELERDDGRWIYEGEIRYNQMEYEFEMDASTGNFLQWSVEHWD